MSQRAEIKALVAGLIEVRIFYLEMIDDNERKLGVNIIICCYS
jgi:hypothetical protein